MKALSVIICTHNPRPTYLVRVLEALRNQTLARGQWELLVVDNASREPIAETCDLSWHPHARHIRESELGLALARQCGMREASADLLVFVDDDNVLTPDYLSQALKIGQEWPQLGAWGSSSVPEFEVEPPPQLQEYLGLLALREIASPRWSNVATCSDAEPWGAGLCVRSSVAAAYRRQYRASALQLTDRSGRDLLSGGDTEISYVACSLGLGVGVFPNLKVTHLIPSERLNEAYMLRLAEGISASMHLIAFKWRHITPRSPLSGLNLLRSIFNILLRKKFERRVYIAQLRGTLRARSIIAAFSSRGPAQSGTARCD